MIAAGRMRPSASPGGFVSRLLELRHREMYALLCTATGLPGHVVLAAPVGELGTRDDG